MNKPLTCPICRKPLAVDPTTGSPHFPFCNERCRQVDLVRWLDGRYQVVEQVDPELAAAADDDSIGDEG